MPNFRWEKIIINNIISQMVIRAGPNTIPAATIVEARSRVIELYREWLREIPRAVAIYPLDPPIANLRASLRRKFEISRNETSLPIINRLLLRGNVRKVINRNNGIG
jgi:hypothetical protein